MRAGPRDSLMWLTALLTPKREAQKAEVRDMKAKEGAAQVGTGEPRDASLTPHLFPCSGFCLHHGALEPRRCRWTHHWEQQPETDLENEASGQSAVRGRSYLHSVAVHTLNYA